MSLYDRFKTNPENEENGVWVAYEGGDVRIKIARAGGANKKYTTASARMQAKGLTIEEQQSLVAGSSLSDEIHEKIGKIDIRAFAQTIIKDWENVVDEDGKEMEFSEENAFKLLSDLPELYTDIRIKAFNLKFFNQKTVADSAEK